MMIIGLPDTSMLLLQKLSVSLTSLEIILIVLEERFDKCEFCIKVKEKDLYIIQMQNLAVN